MINSGRIPLQSVLCCVVRIICPYVVNYVMDLWLDLSSMVAYVIKHLNEHQNICSIPCIILHIAGSEGSRSMLHKQRHF